MKHLKKIFTALILGFFAFAPPGTLIFIAIFTLGLLGKTWFILGVVTGFILLAAYAVVYRDKLAENRHFKTFLQKIRK
jgi:predicted permease